MLADCWEWCGKADGHGYGVFVVMNRQLRAHRYAWEITFGPIPAGLNVCHHCDNPPCIRPEHLFVGTQVDNMQDAKAKGRMSMPPRRTGDAHWSRQRPELRVRGQRHGNSKLTDQQVVELCRLFNAGVPRPTLARQFGISNTHVGRIIQGVSRQLAAHTTSMAVTEVVEL